jgi:prevent-host-death family protein
MVTYVRLRESAARIWLLGSCELTILLTIDRIVVMNDVSISEFKAKCLGLIERVHKTRQPLRITRHGRPVAEVIPAGPDRKRKFLGDMIGTAEIVGDIVSPVIDLEDIEAYRD